METSNDVIKKRIERAFTNKAIKDASYRMRRYAIGDESYVGGTQTASAADELNRLKKSNPSYPLFRLAYHQKGVFNPALLWIAVLIDTVAISKPSVFFPSLSPKVSKVREAWIHDKLVEGDWIPHQNRMLFSYLVDGISFLKVGYWDDKLGVRSVDTLNMFWDLSPDLPSETQWVAEQICIPTKAALSLMGKEAVSILTNRKLDETGEERLTVLEYWDKDTRAFVHPNGTKVLKAVKNPYGCVPYEVMFGDMYPSLYMPIPHIARTIGVSTQITELAKTISEQVKKSRPIWDIDPQAYTPESVDRFREAPFDVEYLERQTDQHGQPVAEGLRMIAPPDISSELINLMKYFQELVIPLFGVNPYAGGFNPQADFAAQVIAQQNQSGLTTTRIAEEFTILLSRTFRKLCKIGAAFDDSDFETTQGSDRYFFGKEFPIHPILRSDVSCQVSPGTQDNPVMRQLKLNEIWQMYSSNPQLQAIHPKVGTELLSLKLLDAGFHDVEALLESPEPTVASDGLALPIPGLDQAA